MNILIDINHPAHVHVFKNFAWKMQKLGHTIIFTALDKEVTIDLLGEYKFEFYVLGKNRKGMVNKIMQMLSYDWNLFLLSRKKNIDFFISHGSVYASLVAFLLRKTHITFEDTEHAKLNNSIAHLFTNTIITPNAYKQLLGQKHIKFKGFLELCYLHPKYFQIINDIKPKLKLPQNSNYAILRFVSWNASHDIGYSGLTREQKKELIDILEKKFIVYISNECNIDLELKKYLIPVHPSKIHDIISASSIYIGEGATMASECAMLGTPAIYINPLSAGTIEKQVEYGLIKKFQSFSELKSYLLDETTFQNFLNSTKAAQKKMLYDSIDVTEFMVWFVNTYPHSLKIMKETPDYQNNFR